MQALFHTAGFAASLPTLLPDSLTTLVRHDPQIAACFKLQTAPLRSTLADLRFCCRDLHCGSSQHCSYTEI